MRRLVPLVAIAVLGAATPAHAARKVELRGTLALDRGAQVKRDGRIRYTGSYFRMILPGGTDRFFSNTDSKAKDKTYTLFVPGTDRGLRLGAFQPFPDPAFDAAGNALAKRIIRPLSFAGIRFSIGTQATDLQTGDTDTVPRLFRTGRKISGDLRAWTASWNSIYFNQGAPKPNGTLPGNTRPPSGRYDPKTKRVEVIWYSLIVGGPFNGFTGFWHLQGRLKG